MSIEFLSSNLMLAHIAEGQAGANDALKGRPGEWVVGFVYVEPKAVCRVILRDGENDYFTQSIPEGEFERGFRAAVRAVIDTAVGHHTVTRFQAHNAPDAERLKPELAAAFAAHNLTVLECFLIGSQENTVTLVRFQIWGRAVSFEIPGECFVDGTLETTIEQGLAHLWG